MGVLMALWGVGAVLYFSRALRIAELLVSLTLAH